MTSGKTEFRKIPCSKDVKLFCLENLVEKKNPEINSKQHSFSCRNRTEWKKEFYQKKNALNVASFYINMHHKETHFA